ncbi:Hypothetical predicted protein [Cloeon dipterum]|uniref:MBD domain-containing protein n=1 Tax=Cloeon dipterum TaxID=197152 RepID=A0A8S1BZI8_9INSE|nr:Hypothetical predicted protein [Cloeon dipterum]
MVFNKRLLTERVEESLVNGFTRQLVTRGSGKTKGGIDIYVFAPDRTRFRSRVELKQYLKNYEGEKIDPDVAFRRPTKNKIKMVKMHSKDKFQNKKILRVKVTRRNKGKGVEIISKGNCTFQLANIKKGSQLTLRQVDQLAGKAGLPIVKVSLERLEAEEVDTGHREPDVGEDSDVAEDDFFNHFTMIHGDHHSGMELDSNPCQQLVPIKPELQMQGFAQHFQPAHGALGECSCQHILTGNFQAKLPVTHSKLEKDFVELVSQNADHERQIKELKCKVENLSKQVDSLAVDNQMLHQRNSLLKMKLIANQLSPEVTITKV